MLFHISNKRPYVLKFLDMDILYTATAMADEKRWWADFSNFKISIKKLLYF
jgi:hypothetical protein